MKSKRDLFLWGMIALMFFASAFIYDLHTMKSYGGNRIFGVSYMTMNNPFYTVIQNELVKVVESRGDRLVLRDPMLDPDKQSEQIEEFIKMKVDGIFINPVDSITIEESLQEAKDAGIPVIVIDCPMDTSKSTTSSIYSDNFEAGVLWAKDLASKFEGGNVALIKHSEVRSGRDRIEGFLYEITNYPQFKVVNEAECFGQTELAMPAVLSMMEETPDIDFIMCLNDPSAMGAIAALQYLNRDDIRVYGVDGTPDFKEQLTRSSSAEATVMQMPYDMAKIASEQMYRALQKDKIEPVTVIPVKLLDRSNLDVKALREWQ